MTPGVTQDLAWGSNYPVSLTDKRMSAPLCHQPGRSASGESLSLITAPVRRASATCVTVGPGRNAQPGNDGSLQRQSCSA